MPTSIRQQTSLRRVTIQPSAAPTFQSSPQMAETEATEAKTTVTVSPKTAPAPSAAQKRQELLTKILPGGFTLYTKYDYRGPELTEEQRRYVNPDNLALRYYGYNDPGDVFDISDPDNPKKVIVSAAGVRPDAKYIIRDGKPIDTGTLFGSVEAAPGPGYQEGVVDWTGWGAIGEKGKPVELTVPGGPGQEPIVKGSPADKEYQAQLAAQKIVESGKPIRLDDMPADVAREVIKILQAKGIEAQLDVERSRETLETWGKQAKAEWQERADEAEAATLTEAANRLQQFGSDATGYDLAGYLRKYPEDTRTLKRLFEDGKAVDRAKLIASEMAENEDLFTSIRKGRLSQEQLEDIYGKAEVYKAHRLLMATTPSFAKAGTTTLVTAGEYAQLIKPPDVPDSEYARIAPFIRASGSDWAGAYNAGVSLGTIRKVSGMDDKAIEDMIWYADYQKAPLPKQLAMSFKKDPAGFASEVGKELGIGLIPIAGTEHLAKTGAGVGWVIASGIGDALMIVPAVGEISAAVKVGVSIPRAVLRASLSIVKGTLTAPYQLARHPIASVKALAAPIEMLVSAKRQPLAIFWRGSYSPMSIEKALAGTTAGEATATRAAMENVIREVVEGEGAGKVLVGGMGTLAYSSTGLQKTLPKTVVTASPYGDVFKGKGVMAEGEGIWTGTAAYEGLESATATGKSPLYVFGKDKKIIGLLDDTGKALDDHGKAMGAIAENSRIMDLKGKVLGSWQNGKIIKSGKVVAEVKNGAIMSDDVQLIGKYYAGQKEITNHKVLGTINKAGDVIGDNGVKVGMASPKVVGFIPEGTRIASDTGVAIGSLKSQPVFALITTQGLKQLPKWVMEAKDLAEMEARAWKLFKSGDKGGDLYPVFKQYAKWIEDEALLPPGTAIIPVVDGKGNAVILRTRNPAGQTVEVPMMQLARKDWLEASKQLTADLARTSATMKPRKTIVETLSAIRDIPKAKKAAPVIAQWFRENPDARLVGSTVEYTYTGKFKPNDLDMGVRDPIAAADEIARRVKKATGIDVEVAKNSDGTARLEWVNKGVKTEMANVKGLGDYPTTIIDGVRLETPGAQLTRGMERMEAEFGGKGYARFARFAKSMGGEVDLGIGARPPTYAQLRVMQARGMWNTVRDIFVKNMSKEKQLALVSKIAPDLEDEARQVRAIGDRLATARQGYRVSRAAGITGIRQSVVAPRRLSQLTTRYNTRSTALRQRLEARAMTLAPIAQRVSRMNRVEGERAYNRLVRESPYVERGAIRTERTLARAEISRVPSRVEARAERQARQIARTERQLRVERTPGRAERILRTEHTPSRGQVPPRIPPERIPPTRAPPERPPPDLPPKGGPPRRRGGSGIDESKRKAFAGSFGWQQGVVVWAGKAPYKSKDDFAAFSIKNPPPGFRLVEGGPEAAFRSIQQITGKALPKDLMLDLGIVDIKATRPSGKPGETGAIGFSADPGQKTHGDVTLGEKKVRMIMGKSEPIRVARGGNGHGGRIRQPSPPRSSQPSWLHSKRVGKVFHTRVSGGELWSRRPLGKRRRK